MKTLHLVPAIFLTLLSAAQAATYSYSVEFEGYSDAARRRIGATRAEAHNARGYAYVPSYPDGSLNSPTVEGEFEAGSDEQAVRQATAILARTRAITIDVNVVILSHYNRYADQLMELISGVHLRATRVAMIGEKLGRHHHRHICSHYPSPERLSPCPESAWYRAANQAIAAQLPSMSQSAPLVLCSTNPQVYGCI